MASVQKDIDIVVNVGGSALSHWVAVEETGGEMVLYDAKPVGGLPQFDFSSAQRAALGYTLRTKIVGADAAAQATYRAKFAKGTTFDAKASVDATTSGTMFITGKPEAIGRRFVVTNDLASTSATTGQEGALAELTLSIMEVGATPSA